MTNDIIAIAALALLGWFGISTIVGILLGKMIRFGAGQMDRDQ